MANCRERFFLRGLPYLHILLVVTFNSLLDKSLFQIVEIAFNFMKLSRFVATCPWIFIILYKVAIFMTPIVVIDFQFILKIKFVVKLGAYKVALSFRFNLEVRFAVKLATFSNFSCLTFHFAGNLLISPFSHLDT